MKRTVKYFNLKQCLLIIVIYKKYDIIQIESHIN